MPIIDTNSIAAVEEAFGLPPSGPQEAVKATQGQQPTQAPSDHRFPLSRSYEVKGVSFSEIALRPPRGHEYWEIGDVAEWQMITESPVRLRNLPAIRAYAERCASLPGEQSVNGPAIVEALNITDTLAVRKAVESFFTDPVGSPSE